MVVVVVGGVSFVENSAGPDCAAENREWIVLNSLWTFLWKTRKTPFFNKPRGIRAVDN